MGKIAQFISILFLTSSIIFATDVELKNEESSDHENSFGNHSTTEKVIHERSVKDTNGHTEYPTSSTRTLNKTHMHPREANSTPKLPEIGEVGHIDDVEALAQNQTDGPDSKQNKTITENFKSSLKEFYSYVYDILIRVYKVPLKVAEEVEQCLNNSTNL